MHLENLDVLVTGATGFVGSRVAKTLYNAGANVTILTRQKIDCPYNVLVADLADKNLHFEKKFDVVCHLASHTPLEKNKKILYAVNYEGVKNLYNSLKGTKLFIYVSGLAVFDPAYSVITEDTPKKYDTEFVKMRIKAQEFLEANCKKSGIALVVAYLGDIVYGDGGFFKIMISERLKKGTFRIPGDGKYIKNFIHVDDVAGAICAIIEKGDAGGYLLTDSTPIQFRDFVNFLADSLGIKRPGSVPSILAKLVLGSDAVNLLMRSASARNDKIKKIYSFRYPTYIEGMKDTIPNL